MDLPIDQCGNGVSRPVIEAIIQAESGGNPYAIGVNVRDGQPYPVLVAAKTREEAAAQARDLNEKGYSFDVGLMQVNSRNLVRFGFDWTQAFEPCANIDAGTRVFQTFAAELADGRYRFSSPELRLKVILSAYNTGSYTLGFENGYVYRVMRHLGDSVSPDKLMVAADASPMEVKVSFDSKLGEGFWGSVTEGLDSTDADLVFVDQSRNGND